MIIYDTYCVNLLHKLGEPSLGYINKKNENKTYRIKYNSFELTRVVSVVNGLPHFCETKLTNYDTCCVNSLHKLGGPSLGYINDSIKKIKIKIKSESTAKLD